LSLLGKKDPIYLGSQHVIEGKDDPKIRLDAALIGTEQIAKDAITAEKIKDGVITTEKLASDVEAFPKGPAGGDLKDNYPDPTIKDRAITSVKIADWDKKTVNSETGITTDHIRDRAVTTDKLASTIEAKPSGEAKGDLSGTYPNPKIADGAVTSVKIKNWDSENPDETGIQNEHIAKDAITSEKLANNSVISAKIKDWDRENPDETGIQTAHIANNSVISAKIKDWDRENRDETGIQTTHLANASVTSEKLQLVQVASTTPNTIDAIAKGTTSSYTVEASPTEILQVIPTSAGGSLSWSSTVEFKSATTVEHTVIVKNESSAGGSSPPVHFKIIKINLGGIFE
jgi:hypothetical protein